MCSEEMVQKLVDPKEGGRTPRDRALEEECRGVFLGQMLGIRRRVTGAFPTIYQALVMLGRFRKAYVLRGVQSEDFASDSLKVIPEGVPV